MRGEETGARATRFVEEAVPLPGDPGYRGRGAAPRAPADEVPRASGKLLTPRRIARMAVGLVVIVAVLVGAYFVPLPSVQQARVWSESLGPWFVWLFFIVHALITIAPIPRSTFTFAAGVLFPPAVAFAGCLTAATFSAVVAFFLARWAGRARIGPWLEQPVVRTIEIRLDQRGWLAVGSLRMIAAVPFSLVNYAAGLSSVRPVPYTVASVLGTAPGTAAVVFLGSVLAGETSPVMISLSAILFATGLLGLVLDAKLPVKTEPPVKSAPPVQTSR